MEVQKEKAKVDQLQEIIKTIGSKIPTVVDPQLHNQFDGDYRTIDQIDPSFNESNWLGELFD